MNDVVVVAVVVVIIIIIMICAHHIYSFILLIAYPMDLARDAPPSTNWDTQPFYCRSMYSPVTKKDVQSGVFQEVVCGIKYARLETRARGLAFDKTSVSSE